jgi:hypothetical protein
MLARFCRIDWIYLDLLTVIREVPMMNPITAAIIGPPTDQGMKRNIE